MQNEVIDIKKLGASAKKEVSDNKQIANGAEERVKLTPRVITFTLEYDAPNGTDYVEVIKSKVIDSDGRLAKTRVMAQLSRGLNLEHLSNEDRYRLDILSRATIQIEDPPDWLFEHMGSDLDLLMNVGDILTEHETRYFRGNARQGEGDTIKPRVRDHSSDLEILREGE
jgi:hypothetical protein